MAFGDSIKKMIGERALRAEMKNIARQRAALSIDQAKSIGIVFEYTNAEDFDLLKKYVLYLREMKKKVRAIGYYAMKELPQFPYSKLEFDFFGKKSFAWNGKPADPILANFVEEEHDILLDLNMNDLLPLRYLTAVSRARFKVGRWEEDDHDLHDMLIDSPPAKGLKNFLRHIDTYLLKLNKPAAE
ncbi:MAG: Uncharacterized protein FD123_1786 [Bacteroidetes bacterium]|nr:MAG: Uncharacterized protein FD123_1786 [Bacteroidota bacterium]